MWAKGSSYHGFPPAVLPFHDRPRPAANVVKSTISPSRQNLGPPPSLVQQQQSPSNNSLLKLAVVDGPPPSPRRLTPQSTEMQRAPQLRRLQGHRTGTSISSLNSFQLELDQALDNIDLVRHDSNLSLDITPALPPLPLPHQQPSSSSQEGQDGILATGKQLLHRRGMSKHGSSSSGSSIYSNDSPIDNAAAGGSTIPKESIMTTIFARRNKPAAAASKEDVNQRKVQISGPFNFQHVTHTQRDKKKKHESGLQDEASTNDQQSRSRAPSDAAAGRSLPLEPTDDSTSIFPSRPSLMSRPSAAFAGVRRLMRPSRSIDVTKPEHQTQKRNKSPPPRPLRSPAHNFHDIPPIPSLRRSSLRPEYSGHDLTTVVKQRPQTSGSKHLHSSASITSIPPPPLPEPTSSDALLMTGLANISSTSGDDDEPAWPLASPTIASFDFLGEEVSRVDQALNQEDPNYGNGRSPLRTSKSVPMMRLLLDSHQNSSAPDLTAPMNRESWEDDIDYCYEHEVEADCDYRWERPSMDMDTMRSESLSYHEHLLSMNNVISRSSTRISTKPSPGALSTGSFDAPSLSPASFASTSTNHEAMTPCATFAANDVFLPAPGQFISSHRTLSTIHDEAGHESPTVAEHLALDLSRSASLADRSEYGMDAEVGNRASAFRRVEDDVYNNRGSREELLQRSSTMTTESNSSWSTNSIAERHISTTSNTTALTRYTASNASLTNLAASWAMKNESTLPEMETTVIMESPDMNDLQGPFQETAAAKPAPPITMMNKKISHKSHASESVIAGQRPSSSQKTPERPQRLRARTTSLGAKASAGTYGLFPRTSSTATLSSAHAG